MGVNESHLFFRINGHFPNQRPPLLEVRKLGGRDLVPLSSLNRTALLASHIEARLAPSNTANDLLDCPRMPLKSGRGLIQLEDERINYFAVPTSLKRGSFLLASSGSLGDWYTRLPAVDRRDTFLFLLSESTTQYWLNFRDLEFQLENNDNLDLSRALGAERG